jgi:hypothetical protein
VLSVDPAGFPDAYVVADQIATQRPGSRPVMASKNPVTATGSSAHEHYECNGLLLTFWPSE